MVSLLLLRQSSSVISVKLLSQRKKVKIVAFAFLRMKLGPPPSCLLCPIKDFPLQKGNKGWFHRTCLLMHSLGKKTSCFELIFA
jgi:hypothetical protein